MDHIITNADLQEMLAAKDPKDRIVVCSEGGVQYTIADLGRDGGHGRILINFHGRVATPQEIKELEREVDRLDRELSEANDENEVLEKKNDELTIKIEELEKQLEANEN